MNPIRFEGKRFFLVALAIYVIPNFVISLLIAWLLPDKPTPGALGATVVSDMWVDILVGALIVPAIETAMLIWPTSLAYQATNGRKVLSSVIGAAPIVVLHAFHGWPKMFAIGWGFGWSAYCFLLFTEQGKPLKTKFVFLFGLHAITNAGAMLALGVDRFIFR